MPVKPIALKRRKRTIVIAGAGIAGLTAALSLSAAGFRAVVVERRSELGAEGAGIQISPNAMHVLRGLGLSSALMRTGFMPEAVAINDGLTGKQLSSFALGDAIRERHGEPYIVVHRADLQQILIKTCEYDPDVELRFGTNVADVVQHANGVTALTMGGGIATEIPAAAMIAADGVRSITRAHVPGAGQPVETGTIAWRALIKMADLPGEIDRRNTSVWLGPNAHLVHYPLREGSVMNVVAVTNDTRESTGDNTFGVSNWRKAASAEAISNEFSGWAEPVRMLLKEAGNWGGWPIGYISPGGKWVSGRIALIGDAAHAMVPHAAQGGAAAIEDAAILARCAKANEEDMETALKLFEKQRRKRVAHIARLASNNGRGYHMKGLMAGIRNRIMPKISQHRLQRRMDWIYGWKAD